MADDGISVMSGDSGITDISDTQSVISDAASNVSNQENLLMPRRTSKRKMTPSPEQLTPSKRSRIEEEKQPKTPVRKFSLLNVPKSQPGTPEHKRVMKLRAMEFNIDSSGNVMTKESTPVSTARTPRRTK